MLIAHPAWSVGPPSLCDQAASLAAQEFGVPEALMRAISRAETGQIRDGTLQPWPWAVNLGGKGLWPTSKSEAVSIVEQAVADGQSNIDIGCFQLNLRWHGHYFGRLNDMFDPLVNARHAARFLTELHRQSGDWSIATGHYHSRNPQRAQPYSERVFALLPEQNVPVARGDGRASGPLIALDQPIRPMFAPPRRPLIGG